MIKPVHDRILIESVYAISAIRSRIEHDGWVPGFIESPLVGYLGAYRDDEFCGFFMIREVSSLDIEIHACLLPEAVIHSRVLGVEVLNLLFNASSVERVSAPIIGSLVSAQNYVRKLGFTREGTLRNACRKNGSLLDVHLYGLTRNEFVEQHPCPSLGTPSVDS